MHKKRSPNPAPAQVGAARPGGRSARVRNAVLAAARAELVAGGVDAFSVSNVARAAGVQKTTIYRRWRKPQQLIVDVALDAAHEAIPVPDTGDLASDLVKLFEEARLFLRSPVGRAFVVMAVQEGRAEAIAMARSYWKHRFARLDVIFERATARGQWPADGNQQLVLRMIVGPLWFRLFVSREPVGRRYIATLVAAALRGAGGTPMTGD